jgi:ribosomal protein S18 acetylase RimI-like enzyme
MSNLGTLTSPRVHLAKPSRIRLPELLDVVGQVPRPCWDRQTFLAALQSEGAGVAVAETHDRVIGFALYRVTPSSAPARLRHVMQLLRWYSPWTGAARSAASDLELLWIGVHPGWHRQGIGRALLQAIHQELGPCGGCIRATVPESNLPAQLLLRGAGYKAIRIVRSHYGSEDGYLMERQGV